MDSNDKLKFRDESSDEPEVEAHRFMTEDPTEDEAEKAKTKTKYKTRSPEDGEPEQNKF